MSYFPSGYHASGYWAEGFFPDEGGDDVISTHIIDPQTVIDYITDDQSAAPDEDLIGELIDEAFAEFVAETGQPIEQQEYVWEFDHIAGFTATPSLVQVNGISKLEYRDSDMEWQEIDTELYTEQHAGGWQIYYPAGFRRGRLYRATLDAGYQTIPRDILDVVKYRTIERYYDSVPGRNRFQMESEASSGAVSVTLKYDRATLAERWRTVVRRYTPG
jgi:hypothetical protein